MLRRHSRTFIYGTLAALVLRLIFIIKFSNVTGDSLVYGDIANNWLHHGIFGITENGLPVPTYIRLPGYPAFLTGLFALFGSNNWMPVFLTQTAIDIATCFVVARLALELFPENDSVAPVACWVAALCPFTANYVALPLTETLAIFSAALALMCAMIALRNNRAIWWAGCGIATGAGILLRPDGGILLAALELFLIAKFFREGNRGKTLKAGLVVAVLALAALVPWTIRNWRVIHRFQPLAPRYANAPEEFVPRGFNRWVKTWIAEFVSVEDFYWRDPSDTPEEAPKINMIPDRAYDSAEQRETTLKLMAAADDAGAITPAIDAQFAALAQQRIKQAPFRYYVRLPILRIADMWLRPRIEMLPLDQHWWEFDDPPESWIAIGLGTLNLLLIIAATLGAIRFRHVAGFGLLCAFVILRSGFLGSLENPEPRYTLECYPIVLVLAAAAVVHFARTRKWRT